MPDYFVIYNSDGATFVNELNETQLLQYISEKHWGDVEYLSSLPHYANTNYWNKSVLIIQGNISVPTAVEVVTKYKMERK